MIEFLADVAFEFALEVVWRMVLMLLELLGLLVDCMSSWGGRGDKPTTKNRYPTIRH